MLPIILKKTKFLRIRLSSIEAKDVTIELIEKISSSQMLCPHLHIPLQSGDNGVLRKMGRNYTRQDYLGLISRLRERIPAIAITTDILVGFPAEDEKCFQNTFDLIKEINPLRSHIFAYSKRAGTAASNEFKSTISPVIIRERIARLRSMTDNCAFFYKKQFLGTEMDVLVEKGNSGFLCGSTGNYLKVVFEGEEGLKNRIIRVKLEALSGNYMIGTPVSGLISDV